MSEGADNDADLIEGIRRGEEGAFELLLERYRSRVFRLAMRFSGERAEAEEVTQEVFLTVHQKLDRFEGKSAFSTWLYRVAVNASLMRLRRQSRTETVPLDSMDSEAVFDDSEAPSPDGHIITEQSLAIIEKAMEKMPADLKTVLILRDIENFSNDETAEILELTTAAVKTRLHRAREYLRARLGDLYQQTVER